MKEIKKIVFIICFLFLSTIFPQTKYFLPLKLTEEKRPFGLIDFVPENKPKIALALSGGGARGLAQIGVLRALEETGVEIDLIVGTSMGSIVGGMYAAGYSPDQMDSIALNTDWNDLLTLNNQSSRSILFVDQKVTEDKAIFSLRLDGLKPILPTSFNDGQKLSNYLNLLTFNAPLHPDSSFDLLKFKYRAVCTDLITGNVVVLNHGSLSLAMRASSSVTFFLAPVKMGSLLLVDGGLVANIPVNIARENGGNYIVAVNTTSPLWPEQDLKLPWIIADQIVSIPMRLNNEEQLSDADFVFTPQLNKVVANDFNNVDSIISAGYEYARPMMINLKEKIDSVVYNSLPDSERYFHNIRLDGSLSTKEKDFFSEYEKLDSVTNKRMNYDLYNLYNTGDYENIGIEIDCFSDSCVLKLPAKKNPIIQDISLVGVSLIHSDKISEIFATLKGQPFSGKILIPRLLKLIELYRQAGYSLANIRSIDFNTDENKLNIFVDEGIISRIDVTGNNYTNSSVILREFPFGVGDFFQIKSIKKGLTNLRSTRLFDNINVVVKEENGQNVLEIDVTEKPTSLLRIGFRADNEYNAQFSLDLRDESIFGTGSELGLVLFGGLKNRAYVIEQKANRILSTYLTYKINAYYKFNDVSVYSDAPTGSEKTFSRIAIGEYRQIFYGFSLGIGTQIGKFGNLIFEGKHQVDQIKNKSGETVVPEDIKIISLKASTTVDTQDKYPYPESGIYFTGSYESAQTILGGQVSYNKLHFAYKNYLRLSRGQVISPKLEFGFADKTLPLSEEFSLGGQESFFGMRAYEFRGRQIFLASLLYRYRIPFNIFFETYFKLRYDLGSIWPAQEEIKFKDLRHGIGIALSFNTPIGPADFAVGKSFLFRKNLPQNPISWGDTLLYFSIGYYY